MELLHFEEFGLSAPGQLEYHPIPTKGENFVFIPTPLTHRFYTEDPSPTFNAYSQLDNDGWMRSVTGEILFWVPHAHRLGLLRPSNKGVMGTSYTRVHYDPSFAGSNWTKAWTFS